MWRGLCVCAALLVPSISLAAEPITVESLLKEMLDRDGLARLPSPAYVCRQFSSYDRDSVAPGKPGWFANWDRSQFLRVEEVEGRKEYVLMDADGPGAVVRFWATWHGPRGGRFSNGTLRVYLDRQIEPVIEAPIATVLDGGLLAGPPLSEGVSPKTAYERRGHNLYFPIPYAKHCKITYSTDVLLDVGARRGEALYYQINYRTYQPGTKVESFRMQTVQQLRPRIEQVQQRLIQSGWEDLTDHSVANIDQQIEPGGQASVQLHGPAALRQLTLKLAAHDLPQALRSCVLIMSFDGEQTVWCPVGAFFGIDYEVHPVRTWYTRVDPDGRMTCFWVMPFARSCSLRLKNLSRQPVSVEGKVWTGPWRWDDRSMHFHTTWKQLTRISTRDPNCVDKIGAFDVNYVTVHGQGVYVGDTLSVFNGTNAWFGEGDEKIYVDGEQFPSHFGTGTEDYYGYAWCRPEYFTSAFHAQPTGGGNLTVGLTVNSRFRALDAIPFRQSLKFDMELWHWRKTQVNYAPTTHWYARPGAHANVPPDPETAARPVARRRSDVVEVLQVPGAIEGEKLTVKEKTGGQIRIQEAPQFGWSNDKQLWWVQGRVGDRLVLEFPVKQSGKYRVWAELTKAPDYAIVQLQVGTSSPKTFDRYWPQVGHDRLDLGVVTLEAGTNRLSVELIGCNQKALKRYMFGLDYLLLEPVKD